MAQDPLLPDVPPLLTESLPGVGGAIGPSPEDFVVDEIPLYAASGEGEHLYVRVQKTSMTTREAVLAISEATSVPANEIGTAGMKDKHAVTTQWMSMPHRRAGNPPEWKLPPSLTVLETARHGNKLRTGHLLGNRFRIRIAGVEANALSRAQAIIGVILERGLPNYFGAQRFGRHGHGLADALAWLAGEAGTGPRRRAPPFERKLFASVVQAAHFNLYAKARIARGLEAPLLGEVVRLHGTGSLFVVEDLARETPRWIARDIHPTGPIVGPKMRAPKHDALALEDVAAETLGLEERTRTALGRHGDGTRRDLLVVPEDLAVSEGPDASLVISVSLPAGSYATVLVRELTREPFFRDDPRAGH